MKLNRKLTTLAAAAACAGGLLLPLSATASSTASSDPSVSRNGSDSPNWSGYAITAAGFSASASWTEPSVHGSDARSSFWVGLDGDGSGTVEQTGTAADIINGSPVYYAWYEFYPAYEVRINAPVQPGDQIRATAEVTGAYDNNYTLKITDYTQGWHSVTTDDDAPYKNASAEVIAEAPQANGVQQPLADFGSVHFSDVHITGYAWDHPSKITMVDSSGRAMDHVSGNSHNFTVTFRRSS